MGSFLLCFFRDALPCSCSHPLNFPALRALGRCTGSVVMFFPLVPLRKRYNVLDDWDDCEVGLCRERLSERKLQRGQDAPFLQNGYIKCPSQEIPARGGERIRYLFFCMTVTAVVRITGVMLLATCGIGATYACTFLFLFSDVEQCCTNNNYH